MAKRDFDLDTRNRVLEYIIQYKKDNDGAAPSMREISEACDIASSAHVKYLLDTLDEMGLIDKGNGARMIAIPGGRWVYEPEDVEAEGVAG